jgi:hypothetical protein
MAQIWGTYIITADSKVCHFNLHNIIGDLYVLFKRSIEGEDVHQDHRLT